MPSMLQALLLTSESWSPQFVIEDSLPRRAAVLNLWVATPTGVALRFPRGRLGPSEICTKKLLSCLNI
jgi:hypothetical protein